MYSELSIFMGIWTVEYGLMWKTHCHKQLPNLGMVYGIRFTNGLTALMRMYNDYNFINDYTLYIYIYTCLYGFPSISMILWGCTWVKYKTYIRWDVNPFHSMVEL